MNQKIIYQKGDPLSGDLSVWREEAVQEKSTKSWQKTLSRFLIVGGLLMTTLLIGPILLTEIKWQFSQLKNQTVGQETQQSGFSQVIKSSNLNMLKPVNPEFSLIIPKIGVNSQVLPQVPVDDKKVYQKALKQGIAQAQGSFFPGENGSIYLFGHSSNYLWNWKNSLAVFYLLKELKPGDQLNLFYQGDRYVYQVTDTEIVKPSELSFLKPRQEKEVLVLQTCWPLGSNWKRLIVLADRT